MTTPELLTYVRSELSRGASKDDINSKLRGQGWTDQDINETHFLINKSLPIDVLVEPPVINQISNEKEPSALTGHLINEAGFNRTPNTYITNEKPHSNRWKKIIISFVALVILIAGGLVVYGSGYFLSTDSMFAKLMDPKLKDNKSAKYQLNLKIDASEIESDINEALLAGEDFKIINLDSVGSFDMSDEENAKMNNTFSFKMGEIEMEVESRSIDGSFYMNIIKAPEIGFISLSPFEDRWIVLSDESSNLEDNPLLGGGTFNPSVFSELTEDQKAHMTKLAEEAHFIKVTKKHLPEMIDGNLSFHIEFELDEEGIIAFFDESIAYLDTIDENEIDFQELKEDGIDKLFEYLDNFKGEAWIGIFNGQINKVAMKAEIVDTEDNEENGRAYVDLTLTYSDWGKPISVVPPTSAISIQELMGEILGGMFGEMADSEAIKIDTSVDVPSSLNNGKDKAKDSTIQAVLSSLRVSAVLYADNHQDSYKGFCTDKGESGAYQQAIRLPQNSVYRCNDSQTEYAAWTKLSSGDYLCVDSTEFFESVDTLPKGTSCQ